MGLDWKTKNFNLEIGIIFLFPGLKLSIALNLSTGSRAVTVADRHEMHFTQSFLLEVQRLGSTVCNTLTHTCTKDSNIQGHIIPAGEFIALGPCCSQYCK